MPLCASRAARFWLRRVVARTRVNPPDALFEQFLQERYGGGGKTRVPNPNPDPEARRRHRDVAFSTAIKNPSFQQQVAREFEAWKGRTPDQRTVTDAPRTHEPPVRGDAKTELAPRRTVPGDARTEPASVPPRHRDDVRTVREGPRTTRDVPSQSGRPTRPRKSPSFKEQDHLLRIARSGKIVRDEALGEQTANVTRKRKLRLGDAEGDFLWKPVEGEGANSPEKSEYLDDIRVGINRGTFHQREAASYSIDRLFGPGTVVPPTLTNGQGSYQAWVPGARSLYESGSSSLGKIPNDVLKRNKSLERMLVLDVITGNEDRHAANVLFRWEGPDDDPENLRFDAIDNGLCLADPTHKFGAAYYQVRSPWKYLAADPDDSSAGGRSSLIAEMLSDIGPELHGEMKKVKVEAFADACAEAGIREEKAVAAAAVRLVVLQEDPTVLRRFLGEAKDETEAIMNFLLVSGRNPRKLLELVGAEERHDEILAAVRTSLVK